MNITVIDTCGNVSCRPDTTWEREDKDFFVPDEIGGFSYTPVLFAKMSRAGKCIGAKFADRYYEAIGYGVLLYAEGHSAAAFFDRTSVLPAAVYSKITLENPENVFSFSLDGRIVYETAVGEGARKRVEDALAAVSKVVSQRIGDLVAIELAAPAHLISREDGTAKIAASYCSNPLFDFKIIF